MMDPLWYIAYIPVFLVGVIAGYRSGFTQSLRAKRTVKNKKCCNHICAKRSEYWQWPHD